MGSSAKTGKFFIRGSPEHFLDKNAIWDRTPPHLHINCSLHVWGEGSRVPNLQTEFNYLDSFKSYGIFSDFIVPMVPMSSPCCPRHPHIVSIAPRRSPCGPHDLWSLPYVVPVVPIIPTSSLCCPCHPHIILIAPRRFPCGPHDLWSPWSPLSPPHVVPVVPVVPTSSLSSPCCPHHPHVI